jgi:antitoxin ParD1/3/4
MPSSYTLGDHYETFIKGLVNSGRYATASEVVRDSLRLMEERVAMREAKFAALRADIETGLVSGPSELLDMAEIKAAARGRQSATKSSGRGGA